MANQIAYATRDNVQTIVDRAVEDMSSIIIDLAQNIHIELLSIREDISELKEDVAMLKTDVCALKADVAELKVSFFGPFYAPYNVIALEGDYQYALVVGKDTDYLWILSREKTIPNDVKEKFLSKAKELGYKVDDLVWPTHDRIRPDKID